MDTQTIVLVVGSVISISVIILLSLILRRLYLASKEGQSKSLGIKLQKISEQNDNPFENVDSYVIKLGQGFGRIYVLKNKLTSQHFLFSQDFSIAEWQK